MKGVCFLNGKIVPMEDAKIRIHDLGVLRGFGVYDGLTSFSGKPFHFKDHWKRFSKAARVLGLTIPYSAETVEKAMRTIIARNAPGARANLRVILTGGEAEGGIRHVPGRETFFITAEKAVPLPAALYERGGSLITHEHARLMPEIKTTNYITAVMHQRNRAKAGAIEILYTDRGRVLECATSNIFIVKNGVVITPDSDVLHGITRNLVMKLARKTYLVTERAVTLKALFDADEVFVTGSFKDVMPIVTVDGKKIGNGMPGPITRDIMRRFAQYTEKY